MALRLWMPMHDGTLNNYGLSEVKVSAKGTASVNDDGKIGKCYYLDGTSYITLSNNMMEFINEHPFSYGCWFKTSGLAANMTICGVMSFTYGCSLFINSNGNLIGRISDGTTSVTLTSTTKLFDSKWHHLFFTYDGATAKIYADGIIVGYKSVIFKNRYTNAGAIGTELNNAPKYIGKGYINDVRVYDNCLSEKEIKMLYQALILHYPMSSTIKKYKNLAWKKTYSIYNNYAQPATLTKLAETYMGCDIYRLTMTVTDSAKLSNFQTSLGGHGVYGFRQTFKANTKYCFSILYRPVSHTGVRVGGTASNIGNWIEIPSSHYRDGWYRVGQKRSGAATEDKIDNIFTSFCYKDLQLNEPISIDFCCPCLLEGTDQIEEEDFYEQDFSENIVYDCSGYMNNGSMTKATAPSWDSDSIRNRGCYNFDGKAFINFPFPTVEEFTISFWMKRNNNTGTRQFMCTSWYGITCELSTDNKVRFAVYDGTQQQWIDANVQLTVADGWILYTATLSKTEGCKLYINGELKGSNPSVKTVHYQITSSKIGAFSSYTPFDGCLSDFRVYATALTPNDIQDLYNVRASLTDTGTLMISGEVIE